MDDYGRIESIRWGIAMMKLRINPLVAEDLKGIKEYIAEDNEEMADKTVRDIYTQIENVQQFPYMGVALSKKSEL